MPRGFSLSRFVKKLIDRDETVKDVENIKDVYSWYEIREARCFIFSFWSKSSYYTDSFKSYFEYLKTSKEKIEQDKSIDLYSLASKERMAYLLFYLKTSDGIEIFPREICLLIADYRHPKDEYKFRLDLEWLFSLDLDVLKLCEIEF